MIQFFQSYFFYNFFGYIILHHALLDLNLNLYSRRELEFHQSLYGLVVAVVDVDQTLVARQLKLLTALFVNEGRAVYREDTLVRRQP